jgi:asparagine synthetase B (glutamine-hydrolysing)
LLRQGFNEQFAFDAPGISVLVSTAAYEAAKSWSALLLSETDFVVSVGNIWFDSAFGESALKELIAHGLTESSYKKLRGEFSLVFSVHGEIGVWSDPLSLNKIYKSDAGVLSTSWLVSSASGLVRTFDKSSALEYIVFGAPHSYATPIREVVLLEPGRHRLNAQRCRLEYQGEASEIEVAVPKTFEGVAELLESLLVERFKEIGGAFDQRIRSALSGGYDSRMILAALDRVGVRPSLVVYGSDQDEDVGVARHIARAEGLELEVTDKAKAIVALKEDSSESLSDACVFFDGLPVDGFVDSRSDRLTRLAQNRNGYVSLNGGGGEVFRDFFHLPDRRFNAVQVFKTFYSQWNPALFANAQEAREFSDRFVSNIEQASSTRGVAMERWQIESLYASFRCRFWMGRNNTIANRYGTFRTPLFDPDFISILTRVPLAWKFSGRLQSELIARLSPRIASYPSNYGFSFAEGPSLRYRMRESLDRAKPVALRPMVSRVRRLLRPSLKTSQRIFADYHNRFGADLDSFSGLELSRFGSPIELNRAMSLQTALTWLSNASTVPSARKP